MKLTRVAVLGGMEQAPPELLAARPGGNQGRVLVAGRDDQVSGRHLSCRGCEPPVVIVAVGSLDDRAVTNLDAVAGRVVLEVADDVVA